MRQFGMNLSEGVDWDLPAPYVALLPVTPADIDAYDHVNNAVYMTWFDRAAWEHSAALGGRHCFLMRNALHCHALRSWGNTMAAAERMKAMRERWRARGLRELRLVVPDARSKAIRRRVAKEVAGLDRARELAALEWIEAVSEFDRG
jgi:Thioesterase superfamily/Antitoxin MazE-like